jgi:serine/threonine-protein kinase
MTEPHDPQATADIPSPDPAEALDAGLAAAFAKPADGPASVLQALRPSLGPLWPVLLREAEPDSSRVVRPHTDAMPTPEQAGARYQLAGEIARGGMGAVLRGRDVDLGRDLAVKVLLEQYTHRPEVARRFLEEAQIAGQLQHPGVVPVYDLGRFGERPFFTMKLVKGQTLAALLRERADPATDRPRFLGIALQVAQALAYAHAKGVIHRDLKPANIMVGAFGEVQVMDWGLAKVLAEGGVADEAKVSRAHQVPGDVTTIRTARSAGSAGSFGTDTEAGSLLGTPAYMPPEQANGDIAHLDRRADVFGLGALLCEILTGKPPYVGRSAEEVRRKACNGDLAEAAARLDACGADAELVALTKACLSPEAVDRPKDARGVADGLTAYLDGVQARLHQAELAEAEAKAKAVEEAKRRRLTLALAATVLLALTLGGGGWLWVKNERDARSAQTAREVHDALNQATALREKAKAATTGGAALFAQAREQVSRALALVENGPADEALKKQVRQLQGELDKEEKDRKLIAALDEARLAQAETLSGNRFALERAVPKFREAFRAYGLPAGQGEPAAAAERIRQRPAAVREAIVAALDEWDDLARDPKLGINEPHRDWLRAVVAVAEPADAWTNKLRAALAEPDQAKRRTALEHLAAAVDVRQHPPRTLTRLAQRLEGVERAGTGRRYASDPAALALLRRAQAQYPADFWINENLGKGLRNDKSKPEQLTEAVRFLTAAVALRPDSPGAHYNLGLALKDKGQFDEAIACWRKAIALDPKYAGAHNNLGYALARKGQFDEAIACWRKAIALDPKHAMAHFNLGVSAANRGQVDEAIAFYRKVIEVDPNYPGVRGTLALAYLRLAARQAWFGQDKELAATCARALEAAKDTNDPHTVDLVAKACSLRQSDARTHEAPLVLGRRAVELGKGHPLLVYFQLDLGMAEYRSGHYAAADAALLPVERLGISTFNASGIAAFYRAMSLFRQGKPDEARKLALAAAATMKPLPKDEQNPLANNATHDDLILWLAYKEAKALIKFDPATALKKAEEKAHQEQQLAEAGKLAQMGLGLLQQKKWGEAEPLLRQSLAIREKMQPDAWTTFNTRSLLGGALLGQKKYADAEPLLLADYQGMKQRQPSIPPQARARLPEAAERLVQLYEALDRKYEVARWTKEREALQAPAKTAETKP